MEGYGGNVCGRSFRQSMSEGNASGGGASQTMKCEPHSYGLLTRGWLWLKNPKH